MIFFCIVYSVTDTGFRMNSPVLITSGRNKLKNTEKKEKSSQENLNTTRDLALEKLKVMDISDLSRRAGVTIREEDADKKVILIDYLGKQVRICPQDMICACEPDDWKELGGSIRLTEEIFILHYLIQASGMLPTGNLIPFRSMDGGMAYEKVFYSRSVYRLSKTFCNREELLADIGELFEGKPGNMGNVSVWLRVLPHVELVFVLWKGDYELPPSGNILFDESILDCLPTEDCVVMAETVVNRFIHVLKHTVD